MAVITVHLPWLKDSIERDGKTYYRYRGHIHISNIRATAKSYGVTTIKGISRKMIFYAGTNIRFMYSNTAFYFEDVPSVPEIFKNFLVKH